MTHLKVIRRVLAIEQEELAREAGLARQTIDRLETGEHRPAVSTLKALDGAVERILRRRALESESDR